MAIIRLGIIGCGLAANHLHWPVLQQLRRKFRIVTVCNHTEKKAREFAARVGGCDYHLDYHDVYTRGDVDAVSIILPIHLNHPAARDAMKAGKHVLLEKPIAASLEEGRDLVRRARKATSVAMIAENFRYRPTIRKLKSLLDRGSIGRIRSAQWIAFHQMTPRISPYARTQWRLDHQFPGGFITDGGVHYVHALRYLLGEFRSCFARTDSVNSGIGEIDTLHLHFETQKGVLGYFHFAFSVPGIRENRLILFGEKGVITLAGNAIDIYTGKSRHRKIEIADSGGYKEQYVDFHRAITRGIQPGMTFEEGLRDLNVFLCAYESAKTGQPVTIKS